MTTSSVPPGCPLSSGEFECAVLLADGLSQIEIADRRQISKSTVRSQLSSTFKKLGAATQAQCVMKIASAGWFDPVDLTWCDSRLSAAQSLYIRAFDRSVRAPEDDALRQERIHHLRSMYYESDKQPPWERVL